MMVVLVIMVLTMYRFENYWPGIKFKLDSALRQASKFKLELAVYESLNILTLVRNCLQKFAPVRLRAKLKVGTYV